MPSRAVLPKPASRANSSSGVLAVVVTRTTRPGVAEPHPVARADDALGPVRACRHADRSRRVVGVAEDRRALERGLPRAGRVERAVDQAGEADATRFPPKRHEPDGDLGARVEPDGRPGREVQVPAVAGARSKSRRGLTSKKWKWLLTLTGTGAVLTTLTSTRRTA